MYIGTLKVMSCIRPRPTTFNGNNTWFVNPLPYPAIRITKKELDIVRAPTFIFYPGKRNASSMEEKRLITKQCLTFFWNKSGMLVKYFYCIQRPPNLQIGLLRGKHTIL